MNDPVREAAALLREVMDWHRDPDNGAYNKCEDEPCEWCVAAARVVKGLDAL